MNIILTESQLKKLIERSIPVFHGSVHDIDKFDTAKVGKGEGSQWFGWGLYFTDVDDIADYYQKSIREKYNAQNEDKFNIFYKDKKIGESVSSILSNFYPKIDPRTFLNILVNESGVMKHDFNTLSPDFYAYNLLTFFDIPPAYHLNRKYDSPLQRIMYYIQDLNLKIKNLPQNKEKNYLPFYDQNQVVDFLNGNELRNLTLPFHQASNYKPTQEERNRFIYLANNIFGNIKPEDFNISPIKQNVSYKYSVTLHKGKTPDQYDYLNWFEQLTPNQKEKIIKQFKNENIKPKKTFYIVSETGDEVDWIKQPKYFLTYQMARDHVKQNKDNPNNYFLDIPINHLVIKKDEFNLSDVNKPVGEFYVKLAGLLGSPKNASLFLLRSGIDGIKYKTDSRSNIESRGFNYVVFDKEAITIEKKEENK